MSRILGVDPGSRKTGWGVLEVRAGNPVHLGHGVIKLTSKQSVAERLATIHAQLSQAIEGYSVQTVVLETVFVAGNVASAIKLGQARGAALAAAGGGGGVACFEYQPTSIKQAVVGHGRADKNQVSVMVRRLLGLHGELPEDASDALAVALCHLFQYSAKERIRDSVVPL